jgi:hypothetical protein
MNNFVFQRNLFAQWERRPSLSELKIAEIPITRQHIFLC